VAVSRNRKQTNARRRSRAGSKRRGTGKRRWFVLPLALGFAGLALYVLAFGGRLDFLDPGEPPMDDIGDASRLRIENLLREAEQGEAGRP
jgi:hypothetical protein